MMKQMAKQCPEKVLQMKGKNENLYDNKKKMLL